MGIFQEVSNWVLGSYKVLTDKNALAENQQVVRSAFSGAQGATYVTSTTVLAGSTVDKLLVNNSPASIYAGMIVRIETGAPLYQEREIASVSTAAPFSVTPTMPFTQVPTIGAILTYRKKITLLCDSGGSPFVNISGAISTITTITPNALQILQPIESVPYTSFNNFFQSLFTISPYAAVNTILKNTLDTPVGMSFDGGNTHVRIEAGTEVVIGGDAIATYSQSFSNGACSFEYEGPLAPTVGTFEIRFETEV